MFGYIRPMESELLVREYREYRAYYCGLCKTIASGYGLAARLTLHYDCAFLAALLTAGEGTVQCENQRCCLHCLRGKQPMAAPTKALLYSADVNVILGWHAAMDKWKDERHLGAAILLLFLRPAYRKANLAQPQLSQSVCSCLERLNGLEKAGAACTDEPSDAFGDLMKAVIEYAPIGQPAEREAYRWMFYNLGRWVYLADAWEDREKDGRSGSYNPFLITKKTREDAAFLMQMSLDEAEKGYDLISLAGAHGITDNVMRLGCRERTRQILGDTGDSKEIGA